MMQAVLRRYPSWMLDKLSVALMDYIACPHAWMVGSSNRVQLSEATGLSQKQIQQYFYNHRRAARSSVARRLMHTKKRHSLGEI